MYISDDKIRLQATLNMPEENPKNGSVLSGNYLRAAQMVHVEDVYSAYRTRFHRLCRYRRGSSLQLR